MFSSIGGFDVWQRRDIAQKQAQASNDFMSIEEA